MSTFEDDLKSLGPRPQPRPGGASWQADHEWFKKYLALCPKDGPDLMRRFHVRRAKESNG